MSYILATMENKPRWYCCQADCDGQIIGFDLLTQRDLKRVLRFGDKPTAKYAAKAFGLKTWRYVKF